jgi:hypothetical protein
MASLGEKPLVVERDAVRTRSTEDYQVLMIYGKRLNDIDALSRWSEALHEMSVLWSGEHQVPRALPHMRQSSWGC